MSKKKLDWSKLPPELSYLAEPAEKYGHYQFDDRIWDFLTTKMTESEAWELIALRNRFREEYRAIKNWLNKYDMTKHDEARLVHFMGCLVGTADDAKLFDEYEQQSDEG